MKIGPTELTAGVVQFCVVSVVLRLEREDRPLHFTDA